MPAALIVFMTCAFFSMALAYSTFVNWKKSILSAGEASIWMAFWLLGTLMCWMVLFSAPAGYDLPWAWVGGGVLFLAMGLQWRSYRIQCLLRRQMEDLIRAQATASARVP